jgi:hypothetical protein
VTPSAGPGATLKVALEITPKRSFATAIDWPGWSRSGKTEALALEALAAYAPRYRAVAKVAGLTLPERPVLEVVETNDGGSGTVFGVPSHVTDADRRPTSKADAVRLAELVESAWARLAAVAATAPEELRKGPRGGGRDKTKMLTHVLEADGSYAREIGGRMAQPALDDANGVAALRGAMLDVLREPSDGSPLAGRRWTARYAAGRIAWHALDHAWEIEDRADPMGGFDAR